MSRLLAASKPPPLAFALLAIAAIFVFVAGFEHARLFHRGYAEVEVVGLLFLLNGIASAVVVAALLLDRTALFVLGALSISIGSIVSILISHNASFFGFAEGGYDADATIILASEVLAVVFTVAGIATGGMRARQARTQDAQRSRVPA